MLDAFSTFVRKRRQELDKTQREIALACGVNPVMITMIEAGRRRPDPDWVPRLSDALETDRQSLCQLAAKTWHPTFHAELAGETIPTEGLPAADHADRVTVEITREDAAWLRSLKGLNVHARRQLQGLTEQLAHPPVAH